MTDGKPTAAPGRDWTDERLVRACLDGNDEAWSALIDKYKRLIYSIPIRHGLPADEASEIFQQVCVDLLAELHCLKDPKSLGGWLITVTSHKCYRHTRREGRITPLSEAAEATLAASERADTLVFELEREKILHSAVAELSSRCRELVHMLFFETPAIPYEQVAKNLRLARGSIGFIRMRCLKKLRGLLLEKGFL
jgi:RNA polymerase sigma factor (sigma-70 family)